MFSLFIGLFISKKNDLSELQNWILFKKNKKQLKVVLFRDFLTQP